MEQRITVRIAGRDWDVIQRDRTTLVNGVAVNLQTVSTDGNSGIEFEADDARLRAVFDRGDQESYVLFRGREVRVEWETARDRLLKAAAGSSHRLHHHAEIRATMPGLVRRVLAVKGNAVRRGDAILILEAMKMENEIQAPVDGTIDRLSVREGQTVEKGDLLAAIG
jgi:biotin carboxyl carrier protein